MISLAEMAVQAIAKGVAPAATAFLLALCVIQVVAAQEAPRAAGDAISGPRELLALLGVEEEQWAQWRDDQPVSTAELQQLLGIVFRFSRFHPADWELWQSGRDAIDTAIAEPAAARGTILACRGEVVQVARWKVDAELLERFEVPQLYVVRVRANSDHGPVSIQFATPRIPDAWTRRAGRAVGQPVEVVGLMLKRMASAGAQSPPGLLLAGPRLRWFPVAEDRELGVFADQLPLVRAGFPFELLDDARATNGQPLGKRDREAFLQVLRACRHIDDPPSPATESLIDLLKHPLDWIGRPVRLRGRTRRVARVHITDSRDRERLGFEHYYQIDVFVDLAGARIEIQPPPGTPRTNAAPAVLSNVYPVTVCTTKLPPAMRDALGDQPSANIRQDVELDGYCYKLWSYYSPLVARFGAGSRQSVPLVMATRIRPRTVVQSRDPIASLVALATVALVVGIGWWAWRSNRAERNWRAKLRQRQDQNQ